MDLDMLDSYTPYAWPGGYPQYIVMSDGGMICAECAHENMSIIIDAFATDDRNSSWYPIDIDVLYESEGEICAHCYAPLESAYGEED